MNDENGDKQFDASEQKLRKAREKGDIPRSTEINTAIVYLGLWIGFMLVCTFGITAWLDIVELSFGLEDWTGSGVFDVARTLTGYAAIGTLVWIAIPILLLLVVLVAMKSLVFSPDKLAPDFKRINPVHNFRQKFGGSGLVTFFMTAVKAALVFLMGAILFSSLWSIMAAMLISDGDVWIEMIGKTVDQVLIMGLSISALFGVVDIVYRRYDHHKRNRMTRQEVEDEHKEAEGDPHLKANRRQKAIEIATQNMIADVPNASVVIVNPTHYAIALEWSRGSAHAPICRAKGTDKLAANICRVARDHGILIWCDPPTARSIYRMTKVGEEILSQHFSAVATAIRFSEHMDRRVKST